MKTLTETPPLDGQQEFTPEIDQDTFEAVEREIAAHDAFEAEMEWEAHLQRQEDLQILEGEQYQGLHGPVFGRYY